MSLARGYRFGELMQHLRRGPGQVMVISSGIQQLFVGHAVELLDVATLGEVIHAVDFRPGIQQGMLFIG